MRNGTEERKPGNSPRGQRRAGDYTGDLARESTQETTRKTAHGRPHTGDHTGETTRETDRRRFGNDLGILSTETAGKTNILRWPREGKPKGDTRETIRKQNRFAHKFWRRETNHGTVFDPKMGPFFNAAQIKKLLRGSKKGYQI